MSDPKPGAQPDHPDEEDAQEEPQSPAPQSPAPQAPAPQSPGTPAGAQASHAQVPEVPPEQRVRIGDVHELPPHAAARGVAAGAQVDFKRSARRGRFKLAVTSSFALTIVFLELLWLAPGVGIAFGVLMAPLMVYLIRITRTYMEDESSFRRGMATTGSIVITIFGALLFMFVSFATIFWIICGRTSHF